MLKTSRDCAVILFHHHIMMKTLLSSGALSSSATVGTFFFGLVIKLAIEMLRFARAQFVTLSTRAFASSKRRIIKLAHTAFEKPVSLVSHHFGNLELYLE